MAGLALDRGAFEYILQVTTVAGDFDMGEVEWETGILMVELLRHEIGADRQGSKQDKAYRAYRIDRRTVP